MKKQKHLLILFAFTIMNLFAFQNCGKQGANIILSDQSGEIMAMSPKNLYMIDQDSEAKEFKLESLYPQDKSKLVQYNLRNNELPFKTTHGKITDFDSKFGVFYYQPDEGYYGDDIIDYVEESLITKIGTPTRTEKPESSNGNPVVISQYHMQFRVVVKPPLELTLGSTTLLTETPLIQLKSPILSDADNAKLYFQVQVVLVDEATDAETPVSGWTKIKNNSKIKGLKLLGTTNYKVNVKKIVLPGYDENTYSASWTTMDKSFSLTLGAIPDSLSETPTISISNIENPQADAATTFDVQISTMLNNSKVILKSPSGLDWFKNVKNGTAISGVTLVSQADYFIEIQNISSSQKALKNLVTNWKPQVTVLSSPTNLTVKSLISSGAKALSESPTLGWGPADLLNKVKNSKNLKFELNVFDLDNSTAPPAYTGTPNLNPDGTVSVPGKFEDGKSYAFKVRVVSVDATGKVLKAETLPSFMSKSWKVKFEVNCQVEMNAPIGAPCTDGTVLLGMTPNRLMKIYTPPNNGVFTLATWSEANKACLDMNSDPKYANLQGWRLPNSVEVIAAALYKQQKTVSLGYYTPDKLSISIANDTYYLNKALTFNVAAVNTWTDRLSASGLWTSTSEKGTVGSYIRTYYKVYLFNEWVSADRSLDIPTTKHYYFCVRTE